MIKPDMTPWLRTCESGLPGETGSDRAEGGIRGSPVQNDALVAKDEHAETDADRRRIEQRLADQASSPSHR